MVWREAVRIVLDIEARAFLESRHASPWGLCLAEIPARENQECRNCSSHETRFSSDVSCQIEGQLPVLT
jgi:hypothetical protein